MHLHHDKHHQGYVNNLNGALLRSTPTSASTPHEDFCATSAAVPEDVRTTVRNNGGGHVNHSMFWSIMKPGRRRRADGRVAPGDQEDFGDFAGLPKANQQTRRRPFGSGWCWLIWTAGGNLANHLHPQSGQPADEGKYPDSGH